MKKQFSRTELLIGKEKIEKLNCSKVVIFGLGGVGSYVLEGLVRAGIENFILVDNDKISESNINRQLLAVHSTIGKYKVDVAKDRILDINPNAKVQTYKMFFSSESEDFLDSTISYIVDAIDTVKSKLELICRAKQKNIPIISCMGAGNLMDATRFEVSDISKTSVCPLARAIRKKLRNMGIYNLKVVYSKEEPIVLKKEENVAEKKVPASISFVPSVAGLICAGEVIKDIIKDK